MGENTSFSPFLYKLLQLSIPSKTTENNFTFKKSVTPVTLTENQ